MNTFAQLLRDYPALLLVGAGSGALATTVKGTLTTGGDTPGQAHTITDHVPSRASCVNRLQEPGRVFDVLIIGGGATGTGCAVDAATRGLRTALVEREDFASGTSSKSTKLVHGGVRYLEKAVMKLDVGQLKLVYEALHERRTMLQNAAHLSSPLPILTPCYKWWEVPYFWVGMKAYDAIAWTTNLIISKYCSPTECIQRLPTIATELDGRSLKGAILYYDGQFDDARMNVTLACSAAAAGAAVANYVECRQLIKNAEGQVIGARVLDRLSGKQFDIHARVVINATGPFLDDVRRQADASAPNTVRGSSGAHVTLPGYYGSASTGLIIPKTKDGRVVFMLPFQDHIIAGTTDHECPVTSRPRSSEEEVAFILSTISDYIGVRVAPSDVLSTWSGIRPLASNPKAAARDTSSVVRDHVIFMDDDGLLNITGGKWTTYRRMAEETVDAAVSSGRLPLNVRECVTRDLRLLGAQSYTPSLHAELAQQYRTAKGLGVDSAVAQHLACAYGDRAKLVLGLAERQGLARRLVPGHPYLEAEVLYCVQNEFCMTVEDFISRRTRLAFLDVAAALSCLDRVAAIMGDALGWSGEQRARQIAKARAYITATFSAGPVVHSTGTLPEAMAA